MGPDLPVPQAQKQPPGGASSLAVLENPMLLIAHRPDGMLTE